MNKVDLWAEPTANDLVPTNSIKVEPQSIIESETLKTLHRPKKRKLSNLYVITAGLNRATGRQQFLSAFEDSDKWSISAVPSIMDKHRALKFIEIAQPEINDNPKRYRYKPPTLVLESVEKPEIYEIVRCLL